MVNLFQVATADLLVFGIIFFRMSSLVITMPFFGGKQIPMQVKVSLVICLTFLMFRTIDPFALAVPSNVYELTFMIIKEMGVGIFIGVIASLAFFGIQLGGEIIGIKMGLSNAQAIDPLSEMNIPTIGQFLTIFTMTVFLILDGHHYLLKIFLESFELVPLMTPHYSVELFDYVIKSFNIVIELAMRVAIPMIVLGFTFQIAFAFMARLVPQMNVFMLSMPIQILGGLAMVSGSLLLIVVLFHKTFGETIEVLYNALKLMA